MNTANRWRAMAGLALMAASLLPVITGWLTANSTWITWLSKYGVMRFNTALGFLLLLAVFAAIIFAKSYLATLFTAFLLLLAGASLVEYLFGLNLGIDELFIQDFLPVEQGIYPGRMSPATAAAFLICGLSCLPWVFRPVRIRQFSNILLSLVLAEGVLALMTALGLPKTLVLAFSGGISTHTGLLFLICSAAILYTNNQRSTAKSLIAWVPIASGVLILYLSINIWFTFKYNFFTTFYQNKNPGNASDQQATQQLVEGVGADIAQGIIIVGILYGLLTTFCLYLYFKARLNRSALATTNQALTQLENRSQAYLNYAPEAIIVVNQRGVIIFVNKRTQSIFGYSARQLIGKPVELLVPPHLSEKHREHRAQYTENPVQRDMRAGLDLWAVRADGTQFPVDVILGPIHIGKDTITMAIVRDVSEEKAAEQVVKSALTEKETLLKEVYHRVKNNMQVISSLLKMQARKQPNTTAQRALEESAARVNTMALVHEKLYQSKNLSRVNFSDYAETLLQHLSQTMQGQHNVVIKPRIAAISFDIDTLIPLGLILSELVSNAYKHAFKNTPNPVITIDLCRQDQNCVLKVTDNGAGLPEHFNAAETSSLGMPLVHSLTNQLHGKLETASSGEGAVFTLQFPEK